MISLFKINQINQIKESSIKRAQGCNGFINQPKLKYLNQDIVSFTAKKKDNPDKVNIKTLMLDILPKKPDLTQKDIDEVLKTMGTKFLDPKYRTGYLEWNSEYPTTGYCYNVTELAHYFVDTETKEHVICNEDKTTHWFLKKPDGKIIDLSKKQFRGETPPYEKAKKGGFLTNYPSKRTCEIAVRLGIITREVANEIPKVAKSLRKAESPQEEKVIIDDFKKLMARN